MAEDLRVIKSASTKCLPNQHTGIIDLHDPLAERLAREELEKLLSMEFKESKKETSNKLVISEIEEYLNQSPDDLKKADKWIKNLIQTVKEKGIPEFFT